MLLRSRTTRSVLRALLLVLTFVGLSGCLQKHVARPVPQAPKVDLPVAVRLPVDPILQKYGKLVRALTTNDSEVTVPIEVDLCVNDSGLEKELPNDCGYYVRNAIDKMGKPFSSIRSLPASVLLKTPAGGTLPLAGKDAPKPFVAFRIGGALLRASEFATDEDMRSLDVLVKRLDGRATRGSRRTITSLTLSLTLETPDGVAVRGATATYRVYVVKTELNNTAAVYFAGNGAGVDRKITITHDLSDALGDAAAYGAMQVLSHALLVPYYKLGGFEPDETLEERVRDAFQRLTRAELERNVKRFLALSGLSNDRSTLGLTQDERAVAVLEMHSRGLDFAKREDLVGFAFQLWRDLDFNKASQIVDARMAAMVTEAKERQERQLAAELRRKEELEAENRRKEADLAAERQRRADEKASEARPVDYGWRPDVRVVIVDLIDVSDHYLRAKIASVVRKSRSSLETHIVGGILVVRVAGGPEKVQLSLRQSGLPLELKWGSNTRLLVTPRAVGAAR